MAGGDGGEGAEYLEEDFVGKIGDLHRGVSTFFYIVLVS